MKKKNTSKTSIARKERRIKRNQSPAKLSDTKEKASIPKKTKDTIITKIAKRLVSNNGSPSCHISSCHTSSGGGHC